MYEPFILPGTKKTQQFPRLEDLRRVLLKEYYEAEFEDNDGLCQSLKNKLNIIELKLEMGEEFEVPF